MAKGSTQGEVDRAQHLAGPGLATADDCDDGEEVSRLRLRYPEHLLSCTIALATFLFLFVMMTFLRFFARERRWLSGTGILCEEPNPTVWHGI